MVYHCTSLVQRILRYPLLMKTMMKMMNEESDEYNCMKNALVSVERVADYINEMQRISETYTPLFQQMTHAYQEVEVGTLTLFLTCMSVNVYVPELHKPHIYQIFHG